MPVTTRFVRREDYTGDSGWRLVEWCHRRGADEVGVDVLGPPYLAETRWALIDEILAPFRRRIASAGDRWLLTGESIASLRELMRGGLFADARDAESVENLTIYRGGRVLLAIDSRSGEGVFTLGEDDADSLANVSLPVHERPRGHAT